MKYLFSLFLICSSFSVFAQQKHFIYIQADNRQPFYVRMDKEILSSSATGYLIIPKLIDSSYDLVIGFPKNEWPEQKVTCTVNNNDLGYLLKNFGEKGWGLFNFQTMGLVMASVKPKDEVVKGNDPFANALSEVVKDSKINTVKTEEDKPAMDTIVMVDTTLAHPVIKSKPKRKVSAPVVKNNDRITRIRHRHVPGGISLAYLDKANGSTDTVNITIPIEQTVAKAKPVNAMQIASEKKIRLDSINKARAEAYAAMVAKKKAKADSITAARKARAEELAAAGRFKADSIATAKKAKADSITAARKARAEQLIAARKMKADSIAAVKQAKADAIAAAKKAAKERMDSIEKAKLLAKVPKTDTIKIVKVEEVKPQEVKPEEVKPEEKKPVVEEKQPVVEEKQPVIVEKKPVVEEKKTEEKKPVEVIKTEPVITKSPPVVAPVVCKYIADGDEFLSLKKKMSKAKSDNEALFQAHQLFLKRCVNAKQIERLAVLFNNDLAKYNLFDDAYHYCADPENFPALQSLLTDDYYIKRFKAMLR